MKCVLFLIQLSLIIIAIDGHGFLADPPQRGATLKDLNDPDALKSVDHPGYDYGLHSHFQSLRHYYGAGAYQVCGQWPQPNGVSTDPHRSMVPGPIYRTYKSGSIVQMRATLSWRYGTHPGFMRLKLCKLKNSTDIVTQECLDQNRLKIKSTSEWIKNSKNQGVKAYLDDYTIQTPNFWPWRTPEQTNIFLNVTLPEGLTCDNCVIQWEFNGNNWPGEFANGTAAYTLYPDNVGGFNNPGYLAGYNDILGITQKWINCADVKIIADPDRPNQIYKPDPVRTLPEMPPVYVFGEWAGFLPNITQSKWTNLTPDPYKYTGAGVQCLWIAKIQNYFVQRQRCKVCMDPKKNCPEDCFCRW